jgi:hypothetical protein
LPRAENNLSLWKLVFRTGHRGLRATPPHGGTSISEFSRGSTLNFSFFTKPDLTTQFAPQGSNAEQSETEQRNCRAAIRNSLYRRSAQEDLLCFNRLDKTKRRSRDY